MNSSRSLDLKRRICGFRGHLDNTYTAELLPELLGERTALLLLAHVSRECNDPAMIRQICAETLQKISRSDLHFEVLQQHAQSEKLRVGC